MVHSILQAMTNKKLDSIILFNSIEKPDSNFVYFTGVAGCEGILIIKNANKKLFVSPLEYGIAKKHSQIKDINYINKNFLKNMGNYLGKNIGANLDYITVNGLKRIKKLTNGKIIDISEDLVKLRKIKSKKEIRNIAKACTITDDIFKRIFREASGFKTEIELYNFIGDQIKRFGVIPSFDPIVASGKNSASPHHLSDKSKLRGFTVIDMGVKVDQYCSDVARTLYFGNPSKRELWYYNQVKDIQNRSISMVKDGQSFSKVHNSAKKDLGKNFIHSIGHGLGIDVHEHPFVGMNDTLKKAMVITIEPGIYLQNKFGIRIEDDLVVGTNNSKILSSTTKDLVTF